MNAQTAPQDLLVVDAAVERHVVYRTLLEDISEHIETVPPGEEAERLARQRPFAAVMVHVESKGESGGKDIAPFVRAVATLHPPVPVIMIAADAAAVQAIASVLSGPIDYVPAPIDPAILRAKIKVFLELARVEDELARAGEKLRRLAAEADEERRKAEALGRLVGEQAHRGKNLLAIIQSIALRTLSDGSNIGEARGALMGRLKTLARAYEFLTAARAEEGADLADIVGAGLGDVADRVTVSGPAVRLAGSFAQTFALAVHELAANAVRHGALRTPLGTVTLGWAVLDQGADHGIDVAWNEHGGALPSDAKPRFGFGLTLVSALARSAARPVEISFDGDGFACRLRLPPDVIVGAAV